MLRRLVLIAVIVGVALAVAQLSSSNEDGHAGGEVLRPAGDATSQRAFAEGASGAPAGAADTPAPQAPDVRDLAPAPGDLSLVIQVLHADGAPARGCVVVVAPAEGEPWRALTDDAGRATGPALGSDGEVWVGGATPRAVSFPLTVRQGAVSLTLPEGGVLDGRVLVDGGPPREPFALVIVPRGRGPKVPPEIDALLQRPELGLDAALDRCGQLVAGDGRFHFSGLPPGWTGAFLLPPGLVASDGEELGALLSNESRELRLLRVPRLTLRLLLPSGRPAPRARITARLLAGDGESLFETTADAAGRAAFPMALDLRPERVHLLVVDADSTARLELERPVHDALHDTDLGDIRLEGAWEVRFRALAPDGTPIAGALGATECSDLVVSAPTDDAGRGLLKGVPAGCPRMKVAAPRYEIASVALPAELPAEPLDVVLSPSTHLEVHVAPDDGVWRPGLVVSVTTTDVQAERRMSRFEEQASELGKSSVPWRNATTLRDASGAEVDAESSDFHVPESGVVVAGRVPAGQPVDVTLIDITRHVLAEQRGLRLAQGEQKVVTLPVSARPAAMEVLVTDAAGEPLIDAGVRIVSSTVAGTDERRRVSSIETNALGRAQFEEIYAPRLDVEAWHEGLATTRLTGVELAAEVHVVLSVGLGFTAHFEDAEGRPVPVTNAWVASAVGERIDSWPDGMMMMAPDQGRSDWRFEHLGDEPLLVKVRLSGQAFQWPHDPHVAEGHFVLPYTGSLLVRYPDLPARFRRLVLRPANGTDEQAFSYAYNIGPEAFSWPALLPGSYRVSLESEGRAGELRAVLGPADVVVVAGQEAVLELR